MTLDLAIKILRQMELEGDGRCLDCPRTGWNCLDCNRNEAKDMVLAALDKYKAVNEDKPKMDKPDNKKIYVVIAYTSALMSELFYLRIKKMLLHMFLMSCNHILSMTQKQLMDDADWTMRELFYPRTGVSMQTVVLSTAMLIFGGG